MPPKRQLRQQQQQQSSGGTARRADKGKEADKGKHSGRGSAKPAAKKQRVCSWNGDGPSSAVAAVIDEEQEQEQEEKSESAWKADFRKKFLPDPNSPRQELLDVVVATRQTKSPTSCFFFCEMHALMYWGDRMMKCDHRADAVLVKGWCRERTNMYAQ
jgi:hypothetical protein